MNCCTRRLEASVFPAPLSPDTTHHVTRAPWGLVGGVSDGKEVRVGCDFVEHFSKVVKVLSGEERRGGGGGGGGGEGGGAGGGEKEMRKRRRKRGEDEGEEIRRRRTEEKEEEMR